MMPPLFPVTSKGTRFAPFAPSPSTGISLEEKEGVLENGRQTEKDNYGVRFKGATQQVTTHKPSTERTSRRIERFCFLPDAFAALTA
jgi:hypothetical protein